VTTIGSYSRLMPRKLRLEAPGIYHVGSRGNNKQQIFDEIIREMFLSRLCVIARAFEWEVLAWALMSTHFHLVVEVGEPGLARGMQRLNLFLALLSNDRFGRINHCVGGPYWNELLETDEALVGCFAYVYFNPVRAGLVGEPASSTWTSYRASVGLERPHPALALGRLLSCFDEAPLAAHQRIRRFVEGGTVR
jgi:REP element-mobilizing transposase RayT